jgi:hypothetical protein
MQALATAMTRLDSGMDVLYSVQSRATPSDAEWEGYLAHCTEFLDGQPDVSKMAVLVVSDGGGPDARQRKALIERFQARLGGPDHWPRTAVVTGSIVARGIVTAICWFRKDMDCFGPQNVDDLFAFLRIPRTERTQVARDLERLAPRTPPNRTLSTLLASLTRGRSNEMRA